MAQRLREVAGGLGLPFNPSGMIYNTRLAQELAKWAESRDRGMEIHRALFRAYFVDGRNIGQVDELAGIAESLGLGGEEARQVIGDRTFKEAVDRDWDRSSALGIHAVPTFVMEGKRLVGFQAYGTLEQLVTAVGVPRRDEVTVR